MIASLNGVVQWVGTESVVIDVAGVGYLVQCSSRTLGSLSAPGQPVRMKVETQMRDSAIHLYGFSDEGEREWFRLLMTVQGVGARVALAVLSELVPAQLAQAVAAQDRVPVTQAVGVGAKIAGRIVSELKDRIGDLPGADAVPVRIEDAEGRLSGDAVSALVNLGFARIDAHGAVARAERDLGVDVGLDDLVRAGLRDLSQ